MKIVLLLLILAIPHLGVAIPNLPPLTPALEIEVIGDIGQDADQLQKFALNRSQKGMYSLEKMIALGIEENLDLMTEQTTLKISSEEQTQANSPLWPSATVSMTQSQTEASSGITTDSFSTTLNAGYTFSWYNWILSRQSKTSYSMQEVKLSQIKNQIIFQIRAAYFELIRQNYSLRVLKDAFDRTKERLKVVQDGFELGQRPELELL